MSNFPASFRQNQIKHSYSYSLTYQNPLAVTCITCTNSQYSITSKIQTSTFCNWVNSSIHFLPLWIYTFLKVYSINPSFFFFFRFLSLLSLFNIYITYILQIKAIKYIVISIIKIICTYACIYFYIYTPIYRNIYTQIYISYIYILIHI